MSRYLKLIIVAALVAAIVLPMLPTRSHAQDATDLTLWVFVERHGLFLQAQAERWNEANPDRPLNLTYEVFDYNPMHDNLLSALLVGEGAPDLADIEISKF